MDARRRALVRGDQVEPLTGREFALLAELLRGRGDVLTRTRLLEAVWGGGAAANQNVVDVYVGYLRAKLARVGAAAVEIQAVRGLGYRLVVGGTP